jgi:hypothetical protein
MSTTHNQSSQDAFAISNPKLLQRGALLGSFDLEAVGWGVTIKGCMLFEKESRRWINFPGREWVKADGTRGFVPIIEWNGKDVREKFHRAVLPLAERALGVTGNPLPLADRPTSGQWNDDIGF